MRGKWVKKILSEVAPFSETRSSYTELTLTSYVSTDTLLQDRKGRIIASSLPMVYGNLPAYKYGDILISNIRPYLKKIWLADIDGECSTDVLIFHPKNGINSKYIFYVLSQDCFFDYMMSSSKGSKMPRGDKSSIEKYPINITVEESDQEHIADILSTCDEVIEQTEKVIAKYRKVKEGMLQDLFTRGLDAEGKLRPKPEDAPELYKDSPLGKIPKEWEISFLFDICHMKAGEGITSKSIAFLGKYPVYGGNGLRGFTWSYTHDGVYILIGRQGALCGNTNLVTGKFFASEHAVVVSMLDNNSAHWLYYILSDMDLNKYSEASAQPGLSVNKIIKIKIAHPSPEEQLKIARRLVMVDDRILSEERTLAKYRSIKLGLMKRLLTPPEGALEA